MPIDIILLQEPLIMFQNDLTEQYKLLDDFIKPITDFLKNDTSAPKQQGLISNGYQTDGNIFEDETIDTMDSKRLLMRVEKVS